VFRPINKILKNSIYEIDATVYLFIAGLILGVLVFFSIKAVWVLSLYLLFLISFLLHDLVQNLVAKKFGLRLKRYIIYPIGTKKMYGEDFEKPWHEFIYALSGLLVYLFILIITYVVAVRFFPELWPDIIILKNTITAQTFDTLLMSYPLFSVFWINFLLFVANLFIFAVPLDGGRLLKAVLIMIFGQFSANRFVPIISKIMSFLIVAVGLIFWDLIIVVLGVFVYVICIKEAQENEILVLLANKNVNDFVRPVELMFGENNSILECFTKMKENLIPEAIVKYDDGKYGVIDADKISSVQKSNWGSKTAGDISEVVMPGTDKEMLGFIAQYMVEKNLSVLPIVHSRTNAFIGIIKRSDLSDFLKIHKIFT